MRRWTITLAAGVAVTLWGGAALAQGPAEPTPARPDAPAEETPGGAVGERTLVDDLDEDQPLEVGAQLRIFRQARRRKAEIERMEGQLERRARRLATIEEEIASRYKTLRLLQEELVARTADPNAGADAAEVERQEAEAREARADKVKKLSKVVDKMKADDAAKMLSVMHEPLVVDVMLLVKSKVAARILGEMDPEQAARIGEQMARIRKQRRQR